MFIVQITEIRYIPKDSHTIGYARLCENLNENPEYPASNWAAIIGENKDKILGIIIKEFKTRAISHKVNLTDFIIRYRIKEFDNKIWLDSCWYNSGTLEILYPKV
jgi:hypothetical protein